MARLVAPALVVSAMTLGGCGKSPKSTPSAAPTTGAASGAADPNAPEVVVPGDIPDTQVFVAYSPPGAPFSVKVPEGWARSTGPDGTVTFSDHYNSIQIRSVPGGASTVASMRSSGLRDVTADPTFKVGRVTIVHRTAGPAVRATYSIGSEPNPVTGKKALLAVERYRFARNGTAAIVTLSGAKGADNVDPWRTVTDSLTWK